ncbi:MAG: ABC transporter ATP-binding protein [Acidimicrobiales bacterium]
MPTAIVTERLTKSYGRARGVVELELTVAAGEVYGFLGPNGAGKTTTIRTLLDFLHPTSGRAEVLGLDSRRDSLEIRRRVGYLPGDLVLYERLTGREHLDWLASLRGGGDATARDALVERFQADLDRPIRQLSKGNRQKLGLVQAFMHDADLLVLDEPTAGLDPLMQEEFHDLLRETVDAGRTVFLSSHSLDEVQHVADRVGIIREGRLVAVERVEELRERASRRVDVRFAPAVTPDPSAFTGLPGVTDVSVRGDLVSFGVTGSIRPVLRVAADLDVVDLLSRPADLEEIFLTYYRGDEAADGPGDEHGAAS